MARIVILGNGGHARVLADCLRLHGIEPEFHTDESALDDADGLVLGMYDVACRERIVALLGVEPFVPVVHPTAYVSPSAVVGRAPQIMAGCIVQPDVTLGDFVVLNTGAQIDHHGTMGDFAFLGPGACLAGGVTVGARAFIGANATVLPGKKIGRNALVGAGAVVARDVPDNAIVAGNPAKLLRMKRDDE